MMAEEQITEEILLQEVPKYPADLIPLAHAARKYNFQPYTLKYRGDHGKLTLYKKQAGSRERLFVSEAEMANQPPVDENKTARGFKRPDVGKRNKAERRLKQINKRGQKRNVSSHEKETTTQAENEQTLERHLCYAFGRVQAWLDIYAGSIGAAPSTNRVGELLQSSEGGSALGVGSGLPRL
jgi:hypothetical protein